MVARIGQWVRGGASRLYMMIVFECVVLSMWRRGVVGAVLGVDLVCGIRRGE